MTEFLAGEVLRALLIGLSAAGVAVFVRSLPLIQRLVREGTKPFACDVCMSFWCTWLIAAAMMHFEGGSVLSAVAPGFAVALLTLRKLTEPLRAPAMLPDLEDSE